MSDTIRIDGYCDNTFYLYFNDSIIFTVKKSTATESMDAVFKFLHDYIKDTGLCTKDVLFDFGVKHNCQFDYKPFHISQ